MREAKLTIKIQDINGEVDVSCCGDTDIIQKATPAQFLANECMKFVAQELEIDKSKRIKVIKITLVDGVVFYVSVDKLSTFKAGMANIEKLEGLEMSRKDYQAVPCHNQSAIFFEKGD